MVAIQDLSNLITKISLTVEADKIKSKGMSKEEMVRKENDRRSLLKSNEFNLGVKNSLSPESNLEVCLSMI